MTVEDAEYYVVRDVSDGMLRIFSKGTWAWLGRESNETLVVVAADNDLNAMQRIVNMVNKDNHQCVIGGDYMYEGDRK